MKDSIPASHPVMIQVWRYLTPSLSAKDWVIVLLMALWIWLNVFDLLITYQGLRAGTAYEANRLFADIIRIPVLAVIVKMSLVYLVMKLVQRVECRTPYSALVPLLLINLYLSWACLHNLNVLNGAEDKSYFLFFFPLDISG